MLKPGLFHFNSALPDYGAPAGVNLSEASVCCGPSPSPRAARAWVAAVTAPPRACSAGRLSGHLLSQCGDTPLPCVVHTAKPCCSAFSASCGAANEKGLEDSTAAARPRPAGGGAGGEVGE